MDMKWHHWLFLAVIALVFYIVGEKYGGMLKGIPLVGQYT